MNCSQAKQLLSAYFDGELVDEQRSRVSDHVGNCTDCSKELDRFEELSSMSSGLTTPVPPASIWTQIEQELGHTSNDQPIVTPDKQSPSWSLPTAKLVALAATVLIVATIGWFAYESWFGHGVHDQFTVEFGEYLDEFHQDPGAAQKFLLAKYENQLVDPTQEIEQLSYRPAVGNGLPEGYALQSTYVMKMPCCTCVQCLCNRDDGTTIAIFEHDDEETTEWFGKRTEMSVNCNGKRCSLVELNDRIAASWKLDNRHITVVGIRDVAELTELVAWFDDRKKVVARQ